MTFVGLALSGCVTEGVQVRTLKLRYATAPQPNRITLPLHIVIDPRLVPDTIVTTEPRNTGIEIEGVRTFVRRDVRNLLRDYFTEVLVEEGPRVPRAPGYVAEVRIVALDTTSAHGSTRRAYGVLDWSVVIRDIKTDEIVYSFADRAVGSFALNHADESSEAIASALETALIRFGQDLHGRNVVATLQARTAPAPAPAVPQVAKPTATLAPRM